MKEIIKDTRKGERGKKRERNKKKEKRKKVVKQGIR
jgi:hypothetical protein